MDTVAALPLLQGEEEEEETDTEPLTNVSWDGAARLQELARLSRQQRLQDASRMDEQAAAPSSELGQRLALRVLRDGLALQQSGHGLVQEPRHHARSAHHHAGRT